MSTQPRSKAFVITLAVIALLTGLLGSFMFWGFQDVSLAKPSLVNNSSRPDYSPKALEFIDIHNSLIGNLQKSCPEYNKLGERYTRSLDFGSAYNNFDALQSKLNDDYNASMAITQEFEAVDCLVSEEMLQQAMSDSLEELGYTSSQTSEKFELTEGYTAHIFVGSKAENEIFAEESNFDKPVNVVNSFMEMQVIVSADRFEVSSYTRIRHVSASEVPVYLD